jgi:hypothetical protein
MMKSKKFRLNAGTGMVLGIITAVLISLVVTLLTGNGDIWLWSIPVGVAGGLAVGAGAAASNSKQ